MQVPVVNRPRGTAPSDLLEGYFKTVRALRGALSEMGGMWPSEDDYQLGGDIDAARREHADRCRRVRQVLAEIETLAEAVV